MSHSFLHLVHLRVIFLGIEVKLNEIARKKEQKNGFTNRQKKMAGHIDYHFLLKVEFKQKIFITNACERNHI